MQLLGIHPQVSTYAVHIQVDRNHQVVMIVICYPGQHPLSAGPQTDCEEYFYGLPGEIQTQIIQVAKACTTIKSMNYWALTALPLKHRLRVSLQQTGFTL